MSAVALAARDRGIVIAGLIALVSASWLYLWSAAAAMPVMGVPAAASVAMPSYAPWAGAELATLTIMWVVMMVGMMLPSAAPMMIMFATIERRRCAAGSPVARTALFLLGYVVIWSVFSVVAAGAQWVLHRAALLSAMMVSTSPLLGGVLLIAAGVFQWTPLKHRCLRMCRSPIGFLLGEWRERPRGAVVMGLRHGLLCVGCCWTLMALLFVAGVMNLLWVAVITAFVLVEKVVPRGDAVGRAAGVLLVAGGAAMLVVSLGVFDTSHGAIPRGASWLRSPLQRPRNDVGALLELAGRARREMLTPWRRDAVR